jgi:P27 family predicted phage terminase small subunit
MTRGRKALPAVAHLVNGNASKLTESELKARLDAEKAKQINVALPTPPAFLADGAVVEWLRLGPELVRLGLISDLDLAAFAGYCQSYAEWADLSQRVKDGGYESMIDKTPNGFKQMSALIQLRNKAAEQMHRFMGEFGLTPASRAKFTAVSAQLNLFGHDNGHPSTPAPPSNTAATPEEKFFH